MLIGYVQNNDDYLAIGYWYETSQTCQYCPLITSEHDDKQNYMAMIWDSTQPYSDIQIEMDSVPGYYDLDLAVGSQLDVIGQWVGVSRYISIPLTGVYFSFDVIGLGFDQGYIQGEFDPSTGLTTLPDGPYRTLIRATIAANHWDGTLPSAYAIWGIVFSAADYSILIKDNQDMSMDLGIVGGAMDVVTTALFEGGYLALKPAGVRINNYYTSTVPNSPLFGFDIENSLISGFDVGAFTNVTAGA